MNLPFANPEANYLAYKEEIDEAITRVTNSGRYLGGVETAKFITEFAEYLNVEPRKVSTCGTGREALVTALRLCGIGHGHKVIVPELSAPPTFDAIRAVGAEPYLFSIDDNGLIDVRYKPCPCNARAIIPVHLYGCPVNMDVIMEYAGVHKLYVIEDCAQACGARWRDHKVGTWGDVGCFSFYPTKNLGAMGDAGAVVCNVDRFIYEITALYAQGWMVRMDEIQAAVLRVKLPHLDQMNRRRRAIAALYGQLKGISGVKLPLDSPGHVYHLYPLRIGCRREIATLLKDRGVDTGVHYEGSYGNYYPGLSLPIYPELTDMRVDYVVRQVKEVCEGLRG